MGWSRRKGHRRRLHPTSRSTDALLWVGRHPLELGCERLLPGLQSDHEIALDPVEASLRSHPILTSDLDETPRWQPTDSSLRDLDGPPGDEIVGLRMPVSSPPQISTLSGSPVERTTISPQPRSPRRRTSSSRDPIFERLTNRSELGELDGELPLLAREALSPRSIAGRLSQPKPAISARSGTIKAVDARGEDRL
jgi:hypothetical protein